MTVQDAAVGFLLSDTQGQFDGKDVMVPLGFFPLVLSAAWALGPVRVQLVPCSLETLGNYFPSSSNACVAQISNTRDQKKPYLSCLLS